MQEFRLQRNRERLDIFGAPSDSSRKIKVIGGKNCIKTEFGEAIHNQIVNDYRIWKHRLVAELNR